ncbi:MAG: DUF1203 domain-containing protein [Paraglaciecola sp.]|nr:DUF1203 domain-containing protein [Paraglaciecola sp.]
MKKNTEIPMTFQFHSLAAQQFSHLFALSDDKLQKLGVAVYYADANPGYPCRVTLQDAQLGDKLLLLNYQHLAEDSPYRSSHAIFVKDGAVSKICQPGEIPEIIQARLLSIRAFDAQHMMLNADVYEGDNVALLLAELMVNDQVEYLHVHTAKRGCFLALVTVTRHNNSVSNAIDEDKY